MALAVKGHFIGIKAAGVDVEPAVFVEGDADGVDFPGEHGLDRLIGDGAFEDAPPLNAGVLAGGAVDAAQPDGLARCVEDLVA